MHLKKTMSGNPTCKWS